MATQPNRGFTVEAPGAIVQKTPGGSANIVQKRQERIAAAVKAGTPFTYSRAELDKKFECVCGSTGKNAHVLLDKNGNEVRVGGNCIKYFDVNQPAKERKPRVGGTGVNRTLKLTEALAKYVPPFKFVRKHDAPFTCLCGGVGSHQIIVSDSNGLEFSVGENCASKIPGVDVPKPEKKQKTASVAGLKGTASKTVEAEKPTFETVG